MARDYELAPSQFWALAEAALGVRYDEAKLQLTELSPDTKEPWEARVEREQESKGFIARNDHDVWYLEVRGADRDDAIQRLHALCRKQHLRGSISRMLEALPSEETRRIEEYATIILEANHLVVLASRSSSIEEVADGIKRRKYYDRVRSHVEDIQDAVKTGEIKTEDDLSERLNEIEVIYTAEAQDIIRFSSNDEAYWDDFGGEAPSWSTVAACALRADVIKDLGFDQNDVHTVDCVRCGEVTSTDDKEDEEDCPKCGLDLNTEIREGYFDPSPSGALPDEESTICQDCSDEQDGATNRRPPVRIPPEREFDCHVCDGHFFTGTPPIRGGTRVLHHGEDTSLCATCGAKPEAIPGSPIEPNTKFTCCDCGETFMTPSPEI